MNFKVYKQAKVVYKNIIRVVNPLPKDWQYDLGKQIRRSALSIILNIAEGSAKKSDKEFCYCLESSITSTNETLAGMDLLFDNKLISKEVHNKLSEQLEGMAKQLGGLIKKLSC